MTSLLNRTRTALLAAVSVSTMALCAIALTGCVTVVAPPSDRSAPTVSDRPIERSPLPSMTASTQDCLGEPVTIEGNGILTTLTGDCPAITLSGTDIDLDLERAQVGSLTIRGGRNDIDAEEITTLDVSGQDNDVDAGAIGSLTVVGDRNDVSSSGRIEQVDVNGNDNDLEAEKFGTVQDAGDRNAFDQD